MSENATTVYIDGQCPMCVAGANRFQRWDCDHALRFVNAHDPKWASRAAERFSASDLNAAMRVQMPDGTWRTGWFAWASILEHLPVWRGLGRLMRLPIFYGLGPMFYRWVAGHRQEISKALRLPPPCDENGVCRLTRQEKNPPRLAYRLPIPPEVINDEAAGEQ